jgi:quercetin dioxygenase-like cupin family protein
MSSSRTRIVGAIACAFVATAASHVALAQESAHSAAKQRARIALAHGLPKLNGNLLKATVLEVNYGPAESSTPHSHPCAVIGYVVQGSIRSQVEGQPVAVLKTGDTFYEAPNGIHRVSANASRTEPASFIAIFICDHNMPLSLDVPAVAAPRGN